MNRLRVHLPWLLVLLLLLLCSPAEALRVGVAPLAGSGLTMDQARVARSLLITDLQKELPKDLVVELRPEPWMALAPVLDLLAEARPRQIDRLVLVSADYLGEKLILQLRLLDVGNQENLFTDSMPVAGVEDLDTAMARAAMALARQKSVSEVREVGQVLENENTSGRRRGAIRQTTLSAGYLWPIRPDATNDSTRWYSYDDAARRFSFALSSGIEDRTFDAGWALAWRNGPVFLLYSDWLMRPKDLCPYLGAAMGFHWALHQRDNSAGDHETQMLDGFHLDARAGLILYRTYDFQLVLQGDYIVTFNDATDRAWMFGLGIRP